MLDVHSFSGNQSGAPPNKLKDGRYLISTFIKQYEDELKLNEKLMEQENQG